MGSVNIDPSGGLGQLIQGDDLRKTRCGGIRIVLPTRDFSAAMFVFVDSKKNRARGGHSRRCSKGGWDTPLGRPMGLPPYSKER
jgi:hypothetical protein